MELKEFKKIFKREAMDAGFEENYEGFVKASAECIVVIILQKSKYGEYFDLNIKVFVQRLFGRVYAITKDVVNKDIGNVFRRQPTEYSDVFNLDNDLSIDERKLRLHDLFRLFVIPFTNKLLTRKGIKELSRTTSPEIHLLPAVKAELESDES